jgi:hypothetical protein
METPATRYSGKTTLNELLFFDKGAMSFLDKEIPRPVQEEILKAATSCTWLGRWKLLTLTDKSRRLKVVKVAPLFIAFCQPKDFKPFQWGPRRLRQNWRNSRNRIRREEYRTQGS